MKDNLIRSIVRGLTAIQVINRDPALTMNEIATAVDVPYPTACRIVQTLISAGYVEREPQSRRYRPTALVQTLSTGYRNENALATIARPVLLKITEALKWPVAVSTRVGNMMMIRECTHDRSAWTFQKYQPGFTVPLLESTAGRVFLAFCPDELRDDILQSVISQNSSHSDDKSNLQDTIRYLDEIKRVGYATRLLNEFGETPGKTSSLSVPVFQKGEVCASLTVVFFASSFKLTNAVETYAKPLQAAAQEIEDSLSLDHTLEWTDAL